MARTVADLPAGSRITDYISLGVVARFFPVIDRPIFATRRAEPQSMQLVSGA
jgi:hypothetical protein